MYLTIFLEHVSFFPLFFSFFFSLPLFDFFDFRFSILLFFFFSFFF